MSFNLDVDKAIEAAAILMDLAPQGTISRKRLMALLYIADRDSLQATGRPIIGGELVAMPYGPIHSEVYDLIKHAAGGNKWTRHFDNVHFWLRLREKPKPRKLSRYERDLLTEVSSRYVDADDWDVAEETHKFQEYTTCYRQNTSTPICLDRIIEAVGRGPDKEAILQQAKDMSFYDHLFGDCK